MGTAEQTPRGMPLPQDFCQGTSHKVLRALEFQCGSKVDEGEVDAGACTMLRRSTQGKKLPQVSLFWTPLSPCLDNTLFCSYPHAQRAHDV